MAPPFSKEDGNVGCILLPVSEAGMMVSTFQGLTDQPEGKQRPPGEEELIHVGLHRYGQSWGIEVGEVVKEGKKSQRRLPVGGQSRKVCSFSSKVGTVRLCLTSLRRRKMQAKEGGSLARSLEAENEVL
jgi:hypothetical protein